MRQNNRIAFIAATLTALTPLGLSAQTWTIMDSFQVAPRLNARALSIGTDSTKRLLYSAGYGAIDTTGTIAGLVRASADSGRTWGTLDAWASPNWPYFDYQTVCCTPIGVLLAGGEAYDSTANTTTKNWVIRGSSDGGATWTVRDIVDSGIGGKPCCRDIKAAPSGEIYAAGLTATNQGAGGWVWLVRKSFDSGASWTTVDSFWNAAVKEARAIGLHPSGNVLVAGMVNRTWTTRRSSDHGATWTTVDTYSGESGLASEAYGMAVDSSGVVYVAGMAKAFQNGSYHNQWVVRQSLDAGTTWSIVDNLTLDSSGSSASTASGATAITIAPSGAILVAGCFASTDGSSRWLVRQGVPGKLGISWSNVDNYQMAPGQSSRANGITVDAYGSIFACGRAADSNGSEHWLTRRH